MSEKNLDDKSKPAPGEDRPAEPCCLLQSIVSIDSRGQIVLPKDIRDRAEIQAGDRLAVICHEADGEVCCISLIKIDRFSGAVNRMLEPFLKGQGKETDKER